MSKWYFINVERGNIADKLQPRSINVSSTNNSNVTLDLSCLTTLSHFLIVNTTSLSRAPRGGVTRQGVVLTDLHSLLDCQ